jgi:hypothetical protein
METFATLDAKERRSVFEEFQLREGVSAVIAEKDFWVVWLLARIFKTPELGGHAIFKGGTSLSMVFGAIARFSEDIDLGISPEALGWSEAQLETASKNAWTERIRPKLEADCARHVERIWLPVLESVAVRELGPAAPNKFWFHYQLDKTSRSPVIFFDYPGALSRGVEYIARSVKIEFGSLADQRPTGSHPIRAMVSKVVPVAFSDFNAEVVALEIERTFWEKATILHAEFHRPFEKTQPPRYARHYADFAALWRHPSGTTAGKQLDLLERVRIHKSRYFASDWANYATAVAGTLRLVPPENRWTELNADYEAMRPMFITEPLTFNEMLAILRGAEHTLNRV